MRDYQTWPLSPNFLFKKGVSRGKKELSDEVHQAVEDIWQKEQALRQNIFNGQVLSLVHFDRQELIGEFIEYKLYLAYVREPEIRKLLGIQPLSISCITHTKNAVLFGKRSKAVTQYPLCVELVPSGGIDPEALKGEYLDIRGQALRELTEETGLSETDVEKITPIALVFDPKTGIYEICLDIVIVSGRDKFPLPPTQEYGSLTWVSKSSLPTFLEKFRKKIVPLSAYLIQLNV